MTSTNFTVTETAVVADTTPPTVTAFTMPATANSTTVNVSSFTATDAVGVTGYMITESATAPLAGAAGWTATAPTTFTFAGTGARTAYAWAKDAAGNVSTSRSANVTITIPDTTPPTVTAFTMPATASSTTVSVTTFTATDTVGVTGYMITESATAPLAGDAGWTATAPTTFTFAGTGARTAYAWAKDAAGNVSTSRSAAVTITVSCIRNTPTLAVSPSTYVQSGASTTYTVTVTNNDSAGCTDTVTFTPSLTNNNSTSFTFGSLTPTTVGLQAGQTGTSTFAITAKATAVEGDANTSTVGVTATGHTTPANVTAVTTVNNSSPLMHSAANLGTKYGNWGIGKDCTWCHTAGSTNVKQIAQQIATPTGARSVTFLKMTSTTPNAMDLFGNDQRQVLTKSSNICEVCHHQTNYHQYSSVTKATGKSVTSTSHYNRVDCASCHKHGTGFKPSGHNVPYYATSTGHTGCASGIGCHTNSTPAGAYPTTGGTAPNCQACHTKGDPLTAGIGCGSCHGANGGTGEPNGTVHPNAVGSHPKHTALAQVTSCSYCHDAGGDAGNPADHGPGNRGNAVTNPAVVNLASTLQWSGAPNNQCNNASCHANVYSPTGTTPTPAWGTSAGCGACHTGTPGAFQANGAPNTGGHNIHMTAGAACGDCHTGAVANTTGGNSHADGYVNVANGYNGGNPVTKHAAGSGYSTCTTASCHADPYSTATVTTNTWSATSGGCVACHKNAANNNNQAAFIGYSAPSTQIGPMTGSHDEHLNYDRYTCGNCHAGAVSGTTGGSNHGNTWINVIQYAAPVAKHAAPFTYTVNGCAQDCHIAATWGGQLRCIDCHAQTITRKKGRAAGDVLDAVTAEFAKTYGHKKLGRNAVADDDCIVCHLEGRSTDHRTSKFHADGNIDLRDPWGNGETPITNMSGGQFTFQRFSTSYASGSRKTTMNNADIAQVISLRFCIRCHSSQGATNPAARSANGTPAGSANMPFGGTTGYTVASGNGVTVAGGTINVFTQFTTANSSVHPVRGPLNRDFPIASRLSVPYNGQVAGRVATGGTKTLSVIINCFDCHNTYNGTPKTLRTTAAHGTNNTQMVRGNIYSATAPNLCTICHTGYTSTSNHGSGSAMNGNSDGSEGWATTCWNCHSSTTTKPARPMPAADYHGFNKLVSGANWTGTGANQRPFAFIRNTTNFIGHRPKTATEWTTGNATCVGDSSHCAGKNGTQTYSPGGQY
ncbi:hypothetical protein [Geotalea sp. SG265]|uniref:hypothetical protein n=1 Tax=Geotalea sp. SG265 TaxID=2922867 RepID=UPI001FAFFF22|nr:hypothetical protein [Geotalea sp. SG265]